MTGGVTWRAGAPVGGLEPAALARWLPRQRWSGLRGETLAPSDVRLTTIVPLDFAEPSALVVAEAAHAGDRVRLCVPVTARSAPNAGDEPPAHVLSRTTDGGGREIADATHDAAFRIGLVRALADGARWQGGEGATLVAEPERGAGEPLRAVERSTVGRAEQSNTSLVYDDRVIVKLFRRLSPGVQPDVEMTRFLTRHGFAHTPPLLGTLSLEDDAGTTVVAMAQRFVAGARDAWAHGVELAREAAFGQAPPNERVDEARRLGEITRAMHDALASDANDPDFAPRPADAALVGRWADAAARSVESGVRLLGERLADGALDGLAADARETARRVADVGASPVVHALRAAAAAAGDDVGAATRHHGDYHLGQVLRGPDAALYVIDFEGEPARPLDERRARHSPLRDVAGMLRSFAYAAAAAALERPGEEEVARRASEWERAAREAFLAGYYAGGASTYLPRARANADALLTLFESEKAFYELQYELRNRPSWVPIPLAGIARLSATFPMDDRMR